MYKRQVSGWATALQLIALSVRQNTHSAYKSARRLAGINASHLSDYLVDEVLDNVDLATRHFLLKSAISVSYTHLDVYKRQGFRNRRGNHCGWYRGTADCNDGC